MLSTLGLTVYLYIIIPKGFFPQQDTGRIVGNIQADQGTSFQAMSRLLIQFASTVSEDPAVDNVIAFTGGNFGGAANSARMYVSIKSLNDRDTSAEGIIARIRAKTSRIAGATLVMQAVQDLRIGGRPSSAQYQFTLRGDDLNDLNQWAPQVFSNMRKLPEIVDVISDQQTRGLQVSLVIDRDAAARLGVTPQRIDDTLYDAFGQRPVSTMYKAQNQYRVVMSVEPEFWQSPDALRHLYVRGNNSSQIPLSAVCHYERNNASLSVNHSGQFPSVTISFNLAPGVSLGDAVDKVRTLTDDMGLPETIHGNFSGTAQAFQDSLAHQPVLILAALLSVYIVLGILYESYIHPITILSTLPSAGVGALWR